uniref:Uncharacterized protein n=1 Tax=Anguilla anguilla TaxID=7936 RepID=A0A0E9T606_ANGAN
MTATPNKDRPAAYPLRWYIFVFFVFFFKHTQMSCFFYL